MRNVKTNLKRRVGWVHYNVYCPPAEASAIKQFHRQWKKANIEHWYKDELLEPDSEQGEKD